MLANLPLLFFLLLIPLSGFIAWAGDRIGHRIGKKRHTLLGLRPRHTAILFTVTAGMCIALVSFGLMWASNATFRVVLAQGAELFRTNSRLKADNHALGRANRRLDRQVAQQKQQAEDSGDRAQAARASAQAAQKAAEAAYRGKATAVAAKTEAQNRYLAARLRLRDADQNLAAAQQNLTREKNRLANTSARLRSTQTRLRDSSSRLVAAARQVKKAEDRLAHAQEQTRLARKAEANAALKVASAERTLDKMLTYKQEEFTRQNALIADQAGKAEKQRLELARLTLELEEKRSELNLVLGQTLKYTTALRQNQITYQVGEEVDRLSVRPGMSVWRLQAVVESLMRSAGKKAEARGAAAPGGLTRAVVILPKSVEAASMPERLLATRRAAENGSGGDMERITEEDSLHAAADSIRRANEDVVMIVVASANAVAGEPVPVELRTYRNPLVLAAGEKISEVTIDGTGTRQEIADALFTFLKRDVRQRLLSAGIIPPSLGGGREESSAGRAAIESRSSATVASSSESGSIVNLSGDEWLQVLDDVRRAGPKAHVVARAAKEARAAGPVSLIVEVKNARVATYDRAP